MNCRKGEKAGRDPWEDFIIYILYIRQYIWLYIIINKLLRAQKFLWHLNRVQGSDMLTWFRTNSIFFRKIILEEKCVIVYKKENFLTIISFKVWIKSIFYRIYRKSLGQTFKIWTHRGPCVFFIDFASLKCHAHVIKHTTMNMFV